MSLIQNFIKVAWRNILRNRMYAVINIAGLAVGIACSILIMLYVYDEYSYDRFHEKADRIYRLDVDVKTSSEVTRLADSPGPMGPGLVRDFPQVESMVRLMNTAGNLGYKEEVFEAEKALYADSTFFRIFSFDLIKGNPDKALSRPDGIVLSRDMARKIFGDENPLGKSVQLLEREMTATVTGVVENVPRNSHFTFDLLLPMDVWNSTNNLLHDNKRDWFRSIYNTYLLLGKSVDPASVEPLFPAFLEQHIGNEMEQKGKAYTLSLRPMTDIYLYSDRIGEIGPTSNVVSLYIFSVVAILILLVACINFMNLATARSLRRAGEVGIRKTVGANRLQIAGQFLGESILLSFIALVLAYLLSYLLFPLFNEFAGKSIGTDLFLEESFILAFVGLGIITGFIAGGYPAFVLSRFRPANVLRGHFTDTTKGRFFRKGLVVFQFVVSLLLISGSVVIYEQLDYLNNGDLGFNKDHMLVFQFPDGEEFAKKYRTIKQEFERRSDVIKTAISGRIPSHPANQTMTTIDLGKGESRKTNMKLYFVGPDFVDTYDMELIAGHNFSDGYRFESTFSYIINRSALSLFGIEADRPEKAIGKKMTQFGVEGEVVGVVENFHFRSLRRRIQPISLTAFPSGSNFLTSKIRTRNPSKTVADLAGLLEDIGPGLEFKHIFLDSHLERLYEDEQKFGRITLTFTLLSIFIACLGLAGLAGFTVEKRAKEIAIRKVIGASSWNILMLLFKDFLFLIGIATFVAVPIAWYLLHYWLQNFAYHITIGIIPFSISAGILVLISLGIIGWYSMKADVRNPVHSLRA